MVIRPVVSEILGGWYHPHIPVSCQKEQMLLTVNTGTKDFGLSQILWVQLLSSCILRLREAKNDNFVPFLSLQHQFSFIEHLKPTTHQEVGVLCYSL